MEKLKKVFCLLMLSFICGCESGGISTSSSSQSITSNFYPNSSISSFASSSSSSFISSSSEYTSTSSSIVEDLEVVNVKLNYTDTMVYEYEVGDNLDLSNVTITIVYEDNSYEIKDVTSEMITLFDTSINDVTSMNTPGYKTVLISYENFEVSYLIEVIDSNAPKDKLDPLVMFDFDAGTRFTIGSDVKPGVTILPNDLDCQITYSSETSGYNSSEYPTVAGTYSLVVYFAGNDEYNGIHTWRWFTLAGEKETPIITFNYTAGSVFTIGEDKKPTVTVSEGADYKITYSSDTTGYNSEEFPSEAGTYSLVVTVTENEIYTSYVTWCWFYLVN